METKAPSSSWFHIFVAVIFSVQDGYWSSSHHIIGPNRRMKEGAWLLCSKEIFQKSHSTIVLISLATQQPLVTREAWTWSLLVVWQWTQFKKLRSAATQHREISSVLCDHLEGWDREGGRETQERGDMGIYVHVQLIHFVIKQKLTHHCKAIILQ